MQLQLKKLVVLFSIMCTLIGTITAVMTYVNLSSSQAFLTTWLNAFVFAVFVMLPLGGLIFVTLSKVINKYFSTWSAIQKKLIQGVFMAIVMESIMAIVTTVINHEYQALWQFLTLIATSFIYALPVGLAFAVLMSLVLQPKLEQFFAEPNV